MRIVPFAIIFLLSVCAQEDTFERFNKLSGIWKMNTAKGPIFESFQKVSKAELKGKSYRINGSDTIVFEQIQLISNTDGIFYIPTVKDQNDGKPVTFRLISSEADRYIFENKAHDFPQRIIYHFIRTDSLVARIEGEKNGQVRGSNFYYRKIE